MAKNTDKNAKTKTTNTNTNTNTNTTDFELEEMNVEQEKQKEANKKKQEEDMVNSQSQPDENAQGNNTLEKTDLPVNEQNPPPGKQMTAINKAIAMIDKYPKNHDEINKPKISDTTGIVLGALGFGLGLPLVMLAFMGMPALAIVALPILLGGIAAVAIGFPLFNSYKIGAKVSEYLNKIPLINLPSVQWVADQEELATVAKLNDTATELVKQGLTNEIPENAKKEIAEKAKRLESIHDSLTSRYMSSNELKTLLLEASTLVTECETLIKNKKQPTEEKKEPNRPMEIRTDTPTVTVTEAKNRPAKLLDVVNQLKTEETATDSPQSTYSI